MSPLIRRTRAHVAAASLLTLAVGLTACTADATVDNSGGNGSTEDVAVVRADAQKYLDAVVKGTSVLPDPTPRPAAKNAEVAIVVNGMNNASSAENVRGMQSACQALAWTCTVVDAQSNPANYAGAMRQAIAQGPDAIVTHGLDCSAVSLPLKEAATAGIPTINSTSYDCDYEGGEKLYTASPLFNDPIDPVNGKAVTYDGYSPNFGTIRGASIVLGIGDNVPEVIDIADDEVGVLKDIHDATMAFVERVPGAIVHRSDMKLADVGPKLESHATAELLKYPQANALSAPFGAAFVLGVGAAVEKAGRTDLFVMGVEGIPAELDLVRAGVVDAVLYSPTAWTGWGAIDTVNSVLTDAPVAKSGQGWLYVDQNTVPAGTGEEPLDKFPDYQSAYKAAWGV